MTTTFAEEIVIRAADTDMFADVPAAVLAGYVVITDDNGSWIVTTTASAAALDIRELPYADQVFNLEGEYSAFWESIAKSVEVIGDRNNPIAAARAICSREGVEMLGD